MAALCIHLLQVVLVVEQFCDVVPHLPGGLIQNPLDRSRLALFSFTAEALHASRIVEACDELLDDQSGLCV